MGIWESFVSLAGGLTRRTYRYSTLPSVEGGRGSQPSPRHPLPDGRYGRLLKISTAAIVFVFLFVLLITHSRTAAEGACELVGNCTGISQHIWGQYSPFFPVPSEIETSTPPGCEVTFALVLARHGARDPTARMTDNYASFIKRIQSASSTYGPGLEFLADYEYNLGKDQLTTFGKDEMRQAGDAFYQRYKSLADSSEPFIRAAGSDRVVDSAELFTKGFYYSRNGTNDAPLSDILVLPETEGFNNTLNHGSCPAFELGPAAKLKHEKQQVWKQIWAKPIMKRLNHKLSGADLSMEETIYMMDLCPFTTVATPNATSTNFCKLFSEAEWRGYDYFESLDKWYGYGPGNPFGSMQGVGYVNELIARLTGEPVDDHTTTNSTLDSSPDTFPLDRKMYADFSHDNTMTSIYGAMGLYSETEDLPVKYKLPPKKLGGYSASWTVPFAGRMYVEKMQCQQQTQEELVRVLVNDRVVPLQNCDADKLGRCRLSTFVESLSFARKGGSWEECFTTK
ncbi:3-phytase A [Paramyrothecium foliicola]|nr:3-phytase A [Paramyrothecium foliicola]